MLSVRWILSTVIGKSIELQDVTNVLIGKRSTCLPKRYKVLFRKEVLKLKKLEAITEAANQCGGYTLDDESLHRLLVEVEAIVKSRPMTTETISDIKSYIPLLPVNLLTTKSKLTLPPPRCFSSADIYCRKRWRKVQQIANKFWSRWCKEFLPTL